MNSRFSFLAAFLAAFFVFTLAILTSELELLGAGLTLVNAAAALAFFDRYLVELLVVLILGALLVERRGWLRALVYLAAALFLAAHVVQLVSVVRTGNLLSRLALDNINHISFIVDAPNILALAGLALLVVLLPLFAEKISERPAGSHRNAYFVPVAVALALLALTSDKWLPESVVNRKTERLIANNMTNSSPIAALYAIQSPEEIVVDSTFSAEELERLREFGFHVDPQSNYPLIRKFRPGPPPFPSKGERTRPANVIVFMIEGYSARTTNVYRGQTFPGITPNLADFAASSMVVENYYNHTAATYRGLLGSFCSLYPTHGGTDGWHTAYDELPKTDYYCLPHIFNENSYRTYFMDAHYEQHAYVDEMMEHIAFDEVLTAADLIREFLDGAAALGKDATTPLQAKEALSDRQLFRALIGFLEQREEAADREPFLLALYNLGTHAFIDIGGDGKPYGDGSNYSLNTIHNLDDAFGEFWSYYRQSRYADDTVVVFTTDHAHFQEDEFVSAVKATGQLDYKRLFVDKIPLIVHDPTRELPAEFDANYATSIDFAPSLVHQLGLSNDENPFLGTSIYSEPRKKMDGYGIASIEASPLFLIDRGQIHSTLLSAGQRDFIPLLVEFVAYSKQLESENRIWKRKD